MFAFWRAVAKAALKVVEFCIRRMERLKDKRDVKKCGEWKVKL